MAFGTNRLWMSNDWGDTWVTLPTASNPLAAHPPNLTQDVLDDPDPSNPDVNSSSPQPIISISFASPNCLYVATAKNIWKISSTGGVWQKQKIAVAAPMPADPNFTCVATESAGGGTFYAGLGGSGVDHIWYCDGSRWISAGLAKAVLDVAVNALVVDPADSTVIYAGTDVGVWKGKKTAPSTWSWQIFSTGLPECAINDLAIHAKGRLLRAATHGRGAWEIPLDATTAQERDIYLRLNLVDAGRINNGRRMPWVDAGSIPDPADPTKNVEIMSSPDIKVNPGFYPKLYVREYPPPLWRGGGTFMPPIDYVDFAELSASSDRLAPQEINQFLIQIYNRGPSSVAPDQIQVLLLLANLTDFTPPLLPVDYADRIARKSGRGWLEGTGWVLAESYAPYHTPSAGVSALSPQIVTFTPLQPLGLAGPDIIAAAFICVQGERLVADQRDVRELAIRDKHVAIRRLTMTTPPATSPSTMKTFRRGGVSATLLDDLRVMAVGAEDFSTVPSLIFTTVRPTAGVEPLPCATTASGRPSSGSMTGQRPPPAGRFS